MTYSERFSVLQRVEREAKGGVDDGRVFERVVRAVVVEADVEKQGLHVWKKNE